PIKPIRIRNRFSYSNPNETTESDKRVAIRSPVHSPDNDNEDMDFQYDYEDGNLSFQDNNDDDNTYDSINPQHYNDEMIFLQNDINSSNTKEKEESDNDYNSEEEEVDDNEINDEEEEEEGNNDDNKVEEKNVIMMKRNVMAKRKKYIKLLKLWIKTRYHPVMVNLHCTLIIIRLWHYFVSIRSTMFLRKHMKILSISFIILNLSLPM
ncbi:hypothetical protein RclHR1_43560001, partial [Rhizophagus clarus]